jgi:heme-degrading monooxygenase HmoA
MHAVVTRVTINEGAGATAYLRDEVVPRVSQAPGFVAAYWVRLEGDNQGTSMIVFESEDAARAVADQIHPPPGGEAAIDSVSVGEVVAHA